MNILGFEIKRKDSSPAIASVTSPITDDGSTVVSSSATSYYGMVMDMDATIKNENELIRRYRETALYMDCDSAIEDIVNESIIAESDDQSVKINLDKVKLSEPIKKKIITEFDEILRYWTLNAKDMISSVSGILMVEIIIMFLLIQSNLN
jgi:hypothetical protein